MDDISSEISRLLPLVTDHKRELLAYVLANRTKYVTVVLENVLQPHNASAVVRSCDIFGVQDLHVIQAVRAFHADNAIAKGAADWIDINRYDGTGACIDALKQQGYRIVATTPHERGYTLSQLPLNTKTALLFGTEITGLSSEALDRADDYVTIPMYGFTESFNISVSVAICLHHIITQIRTNKMAWQLSEQERQQLLLRWLKRILHMDRS